MREQIEEWMRLAKQHLRGRGGHERNFEKAVYYFDLAAVAGDLDALYQLGKCYLKGTGCLRDEAGAVTCFENAANRGHLAAMEKLISCFREGVGAPQCEELARYWELKLRGAEEEKAAVN